MSRGINWGRDSEKRRMRERGTETLDGDLDAKSQALLRRPPVKRKSKDDLRAELAAALANTGAKKL